MSSCASATTTIPTAGSSSRCDSLAPGTRSTGWGSSFGLGRLSRSVALRFEFALASSGSRSLRRTMQYPAEHHRRQEQAARKVEGGIELAGLVLDVAGQLRHEEGDAPADEDQTIV